MTTICQKCSDSKNCKYATQRIPNVLNEINYEKLGKKCRQKFYFWTDKSMHKTVPAKKFYKKYDKTEVQKNEKFSVLQNLFSPSFSFSYFKEDYNLDLKFENHISKKFKRGGELI